MKIEKVKSWLLRVPYKLPLIEQQHHAICNFTEIVTDDGIEGHAMTHANHPMRHGIREYINLAAGPAIVGMNPLHTEEIRSRLILETAAKQVHGAWSCAASAIDIALWDIKGKAFNQPIWRLLGGARPDVPVYITFGLSRYNTEELVEVARSLVKEGHTGLKMRVANGPHRYDETRRPPDDESILEDVARVSVLRDAVGPKVEILIDGNKNATFAQALQIAKLCEPYKITWFEDAVPQGDPLLMARLRSMTTVPLAAGSTGTSDLLYLREYLLHGAVDFLQPNVRDLGGYTQAMKAAGMAQAFNVQLGMGGQFPHLNMHLHGAVPNGGRIEFHLQSWRLFESAFEGTPVPAKGRAPLPTGPGLGFTPKAGILELAVD